jgi:hypothetical protein
VLDLSGVAGGGTLGQNSAEQERPYLAALSGKERAYKAGRLKSRQKPTAEFEIGFHSTLPCLLGRLSIQQQRAVIWDEKNLVARLA